MSNLLDDQNRPFLHFSTGEILSNRNYDILDPQHYRNPLSYGDYAFFNSSNYYRGIGEEKGIVQAITQLSDSMPNYENRNYNYGYCLKKDCVKLFKPKVHGGYSYAHKSLLPKLVLFDQITAEQGRKQNRYFVSDYARVMAGFMQAYNDFSYRNKDGEIIGVTAGQYIDLNRFNVYSQLSTLKYVADENAPMDVTKYKITTNVNTLSDSSVYFQTNDSYTISAVSRRLRLHKFAKATITNSNRCAITGKLLPYSKLKIIRFFDGDENIQFFADMNTVNAHASRTYTIHFYDETPARATINTIDFYTDGMLNYGHEWYFDLMAVQMANPDDSVTMCQHCRTPQSANRHDFESCRNRNFRAMRFDYHSVRPVHKFELLADPVKHIIGVEIEKENRAGAGYDHREIYNKFGWVKERDGSLDSTTGYELVSPMYPLFTDDLVNDATALESKYPDLINGNFSSACGGHIHYSKKGVTGGDLMDEVCGYLPLIYSIYKRRTERTYCRAMAKDDMKRSGEKYQAVKVMSDRIEIRIFPAVKGLTTLAWRIGLLRIIANNPTADPVAVVNMLLDKDSELRKHFEQIFDEQTIYKRAINVFYFANKYDENSYNIDFSDKVKEIEEQARKQAENSLS